jgi:hypothetical protein
MITVIYTPEGVPVHVATSDAAAYYGWKRVGALPNQPNSGKYALVIGMKRESEALATVRARMISDGIDEPIEIDRQCLRGKVWGIPEGSNERDTLRYLMVDPLQLSSEVKDLLSVVGDIPEHVPVSEEVLKGTDIVQTER